MKRILFLLLLALSFLTAKAQTTHQTGYWTRLFIRVKLDDKWSLQAEADNRRLTEPDRPLQFISHIHLHRKFGKTFETAVGLTFSTVWQGSLAVPEWRPFEEFYVFQPLGKGFRLSHRLRTEQRWTHNFSNGELTDGFNFRWRFRYRPQLDWRISEKWALKLNDELMFHDDGFDQNRLFIGAERKLPHGFSIELGYLKLIQKRTVGYFDRDNLRLTVYKDMDFSGK